VITVFDRVFTSFILAIASFAALRVSFLSPKSSARASPLFRFFSFQYSLMLLGKDDEAP
jgi:hypothetical protein